MLIVGSALHLGKITERLSQIACVDDRKSSLRNQSFSKLNLFQFASDVVSNLKLLKMIISLVSYELLNQANY